MVTRLAGFDPGNFLRDYWQKKPLLIRGAWPDWCNPVEPDDLAALACAGGIEARIIVRGRKKLKLVHGPFSARHFARLGKKPWTLLVQSIDQYIPAAASLLTPFRFVPNWRIDDVMASYASDGGGVGPHFDQYDVFLIQGLGQRRWRVGGRCDRHSALLPHDDLRLLADFEPTDEWLLEPGDMLYVPPGVAHDGIAVGDGCMTYSIGFRAPARSELIAHWCDHVLASLDEHDRYADPDLSVADRASEIAPGAIDRLHAMVLEKLADRDAFARWFAAHATQPKYLDLDRALDIPTTVDSLLVAIASGATLTRHHASRFAFIDQHRAAQLFVDGEPVAHQVNEASVIAGLCEDPMIDTRCLGDDAVAALVKTLVNDGTLLVEQVV